MMATTLSSKASIRAQPIAQSRCSNVAARRALVIRSAKVKIDFDNAWLIFAKQLPHYPIQNYNQF